jgi:hypothetical protein
MLENYSRKWGGVGDILFPVDEGFEVSTVWLSILSAFDPDRFATYQATHRGRHMANPVAFEEWLVREATQLANGDADAIADMKQQLMADHIYRHPISNWRPAQALTSHIQHWMSPFAFNDAVFRDIYRADSSTQNENGSTDLADLELEPGEVCVVVCDDVPTEVQLLVDARRGNLAPEFRNHLMESGWTITTIETGAKDLVALLEIAWLGQTQSSWKFEAAVTEALGEKYVVPEVSREDLSERAPFRIGLVGCGVYSQFSTAWHDRPLNVVVGDSADDFCLAMALDRGWDAGIWVPRSLINDPDVGGVALRTLADVLHRQSRGPGGDRLLKLTSLTMTQSELADIRSTLLESLWAEDLKELIEPIEPTSVHLPPAQQIIDAAYLNENRYEPFVGEDMATRLAPLVPSVARSRSPFDVRWQVEVAVVGHSVPPRSHLADRIGQGYHPWEMARPGRSGLVFHSHAQGLLPAGATLEQALDRPRPRIPDASEIFQVLLARRQLLPSLSDKGKYATASIERWGGLQATLDSLSDQPTYAILHSYADPKRTSLPGVRMSGRRFMTIYDMATASGSPTEALIDRVDDLVERQVLRRGFALKCGRCDFAAWYGFGELDQTFSCERCGQRQAVSAHRWRDPAEQPNIYYDLDEVVFQTLTHDGAVTLLALGAIRQDTKDFLYTPEMEIREQGANDLLCEVDLWTVVKGEIAIGEAKRGGDLSSGGTAAEEDSQAQRLARIAEAVSADVVVLATAAEGWKDSAVERVTNQLSGLPTRLQLVTNVAAPRPWEGPGQNIPELEP